MWRAVVGVVAGFTAWSVLFVGLGAAIPALRPEVFDAQGMTRDPLALSVYLGGSVVISLLSGWLAARLAPNHSLATCLALGLVLLAVGIPVQASVWNSIPLWYHLSFLALLVPMTLLGGRWRCGSPEPIVRPA